MRRQNSYQQLGCSETTAAFTKNTFLLHALQYPAGWYGGFRHTVKSNHCKYTVILGETFLSATRLQRNYCSIYKEYNVFTACTLVGSMWAMYNSKDMLGIMSQSNCESQGSHGYHSYAIRYLQSIMNFNNVME